MARVKSILSMYVDWTAIFLFQDRFELSLYHSPKLRGLWKMLMPNRYNETIGIQHCKAYVFDDTTVISGANLSQVDNFIEIFLFLIKSTNFILGLLYKSPRSIYCHWKLSKTSRLFWGACWRNSKAFFSSKVKKIMTIMFWILMLIWKWSKI